MNLEEVLELLEIDSPDEFEYFEHLAELLECSEEITYDAFFSVLREVESEALTELLESYFEDSLQGIPDEATDFYTLMTTIKQSLQGLVLDLSTLEQRRLFVDELYRFRTWYTFDSVVHCTNLADGMTSDIPVVEALSLYRLEKLGEVHYRYDFQDAMEFPIEEYAVSFSYTMKEDDNEEDDEIEDEFSDSLIDEEYPVIDGEYSDD